MVYNRPGNKYSPFMEFASYYLWFWRGPGYDGCGNAVSIIVWCDGMVHYGMCDGVVNACNVQYVISNGFINIPEPIKYKYGAPDIFNFVVPRFIIDSTACNVTGFCGQKF